MSISQSMLKTEQDPQVSGTNQAWFKRWCITTNEVLLWTIVTMSCSAVEWQCQCSSVAVLQTHVSQITHLSIMLRDPLQRVYRVGADLALPGWGHLAIREHSLITSHRKRANSTSKPQLFLPVIFLNFGHPPILAKYPFSGNLRPYVSVCHPLVCRRNN